MNTVTTRPGVCDTTVKLRARHIDKIEVLSDILIGLIINYTVAQIVLHSMGYAVSYGEQGVLTGILTVIAFARKYTLRRVFSNIIKKIYENR